MKSFSDFINEEKKISKEEAEYQDHPHNGQICKNCKGWVDPNKCSGVAGYIDEDGWCKWYKKD
jgi:hypothetical protein